MLTLALGIGANAAVFTLFDQVLLRLLPVSNPHQLVRFTWTGGFSGDGSSFGGDISNYFSYPAYKDLRDRNQVFSGVIAADRTGAGIGWHNQTENKDTEIISDNYFQVLGLRPALGHLFGPQDDTAKNANPVAVLSYDYWKSRFAADRRCSRTDTSGQWTRLHHCRRRSAQLPDCHRGIPPRPLRPHQHV